jgi:hypothetical protein
MIIDPLNKSLYNDFSKLIISTSKQGVTSSMSYIAYISLFLVLSVTTANYFLEGAIFRMFKKVDVEVFPEVIGSLTLQGKPLAGIKLKRGYQYSGVMEEKKWNYTTTDDEGKFSFPEIIHRTSHPNKPFAGTRISQTIKVDKNEESDIIKAAKDEYSEVILWASISRGEKHISYLAERLARLDCDLANEAIRNEIIDEAFPSGVVRYQVLSICRWPDLEKLEIEKRKKFD